MPGTTYTWSFRNVLPTKRWGRHGIPCVPSSGNPLHGNDPKNCWTYPPWIWKCYVDDTFCVMKKTEDEGFLSISTAFTPPSCSPWSRKMAIYYSWTPSSTGRMTELLKLVYTGSQVTQTDTCISPPITLLHVKRGMASCLFHRARTIARTRM